MDPDPRGEQPVDFVPTGRYLDRYERRDGEWRIAERHIAIDWQRTDPVGAPLQAVTPAYEGRGRSGRSMSPPLRRPLQFEELRKLKIRDEDGDLITKSIKATPHVVFGAVAQMMQASGVVDDFQVWDQLTSWYAQGIWNEESTALAAVSPDCDSFTDVFTMTGYANALAPDLGVILSTDSIRRGPMELLQSMLTIDNLTGGRSVFQTSPKRLQAVQAVR